MDPNTANEAGRAVASGDWIQLGVSVLAAIGAWLAALAGRPKK